MSEPKIGVFRPLEPSRMITRRDVDYWIAEQKRHDAEKDQPGHRCDLCPIRITLTPDDSPERLADDQR